MDAETIGAALKRKLGPLPVWAWSILGGAVVYFLRKRGYFGGGVQQGETLQPRQEAAGTPQAQTVLQPGESVYDPNTGALTTAPGNDTGVVGDTSPASSGGGSGDYGQAIQDMVDAISTALTDSERTNGASPQTHKPSALSRAKAAVARGKVGPKNKARLEKAGYTAGQIAYHVKRRTPLGKPAHKPSSHKQTTKTTNRNGKPRSNAHVKPANGGRQTGHKKPTPTALGRSRAPASRSHMGPRSRPTVPLTRHATPVHHPTSSHSAKPHQQAQKQQPAAHRPSAPTPRPAPRAPAPKPHAPKSPKRRK